MGKLPLGQARERGGEERQVEKPLDMDPNQAQDLCPPVLGPTAQERWNQEGALALG